jgi:Uma2 family endonuclease
MQYRSHDMMTRRDVRLTPEEYLSIDRAAEWRSEYIDGEMIARDRASHRHSIITANIAGELGNHLRNSPCTVALAQLRVATDRRRHYTYPDVVVVCDPPQFVDDQLDTVTNPTLIAEVLSDSTEKYDRGGKFERYRSIPSLSEYLLLAQDRVHVELFTRQPDGRWSLRDWNDRAAEIEIESLHCRLKVSEVYSKVTFEGQAPG